MIPEIRLNSIRRKLGEILNYNFENNDFRSTNKTSLEARYLAL